MLANEAGVKRRGSWAKNNGLEDNPWCGRKGGHGMALRRLMAAGEKLRLNGRGGVEHGAQTTTPGGDGGGDGVNSIGSPGEK